MPYFPSRRGPDAGSLELGGLQAGDVVGIRDGDAAYVGIVFDITRLHSMFVGESSAVILHLWVTGGERFVTLTGLPDSPTVIRYGRVPLTMGLTQVMRGSRGLGQTYEELSRCLVEYLVLQDQRTGSGYYGAYIEGVILLGVYLHDGVKVPFIGLVLTEENFCMAPPVMKVRTASGVLYLEVDSANYYERVIGTFDGE